ncbi:MAG TPA: hypothetical protein VHH11_14115 [Gammaproteobacteria bacterium]|nr:hypothetical protein [Gammaproteobacteria bacterium]
MPRAPRATRARRASTTPAESDAAPLEDTTLADAARLEYDDDDVSPINPAVRLKLVADYKLERRIIQAGREHRVQMTGGGISAGMSKDDVGRLCGAGEYVYTWYRAAKASGDATRPRLERYKISVFSVDVARDSAQPAGADVVAMVPGGATPLAVTTMGHDEKLVPASLTINEQWFARYTDQLESVLGRVAALAEKQSESLAQMLAKASEQNAQVLALSTRMVDAMYAQGLNEFNHRMVMGGKILDLEKEAAQGSLIEKVVGPAAKRITDRLIPETSAKPDEIAQTLADVRSVIPTVREIGALAPQMRELGGMAPKLKQMLAAIPDASSVETTENTTESPAPATPAAEQVEKLDF